MEFQNVAKSWEVSSFLKVPVPANTEDHSSTRISVDNKGADVEIDKLDRENKGWADHHSNLPEAIDMK